MGTNIKIGVGLPVIGLEFHRGASFVAETEGFEPSIGLYNPITV